MRISEVEKQKILDAWNEAWLSHDFFKNVCANCGMTHKEWLVMADFEKVIEDPKNAEPWICSHDVNDESAEHVRDYINDLKG